MRLDAQDSTESVDASPADPAGIPSRRTRKRAERRDRIFDAAIALFVERGFDATSMDDIAALCGLSRSTVFNHFPRKVLLLEEWTRRRRQQATESLGTEELIGRPLPEVLGVYLTALVAGDTNTREEMRALHPATLEHTTALVDHPVAVDIAALVTTANPRLRPAATPDRIGRLLAFGYVSAVARWVEEDLSSIDLAEELAALLDVVLSGSLPDRTRSD